MSADGKKGGGNEQFTQFFVRITQTCKFMEDHGLFRLIGVFLKIVKMIIDLWNLLSR